MRRTTTDGHIAMWNLAAVDLTSCVGVGVQVRSSFNIDNVLFACGVTLGTIGGKHVDGTACFDLLLIQAA